MKSRSPLRVFPRGPDVSAEFNTFAALADFFTLTVFTYLKVWFLDVYDLLKHSQTKEANTACVFTEGRIDTCSGWLVTLTLLDQIVDKQEAQMREDCIVAE